MAARGLPASYLKKHNGNLAAAWADYRGSKDDVHPAVKRRRAARETVLPTSEGGGITSRGGAGLKAHISAHTVVEYDEEAIGQILWGVITAMRAPTGPDLNSMFPPPESQIDDASWRRGAQERALGKAVWERIGKALLYFKVSQAEWSAAYAQAIRASGGQGYSGGVQGYSHPFPAPR